MSFYVKKIVWEYGEKFGDVFYPNNILDLKEKIKELDLLGRKKNYPFLISLVLDDQNISLSFTVGHRYSLIEFIYDRSGPIYIFNPEGNENEHIDFYYWASHSVADTNKMIFQEKVLEAIYYFIENKMFPLFIKLDDDEANKQWVSDT